MTSVMRPGSFEQFVRELERDPQEKARRRVMGEAAIAQYRAQTAKIHPWREMVGVTLAMFSRWIEKMR